MASTQKIGSRDARLKSRGCLACIRMKVKCDETKPHCQRCQRALRECPGYRDQNALVFRMETGSHARRDSSEKAVVPTRSSSSSSSVPASMPTDWLQSSINYFFRNYVLMPSNSFPGYYHFLPQLYEADSEKGFLRDAVRAIAQATFARFKNLDSEYSRKARRSYGSAVSQLRSSLNNYSETNSSITVATVVVLWKYDVVEGDDKVGFRSPHLDGMQSILHSRLALEQNDEMGINRFVLATAQMQNIDQRSPSVIGLSQVPKSNLGGPGLVLIEDLFPRGNDVNSITNQMIQSNPTSEEATACVGKAQRLLDDFETWVTSLDPEWLYQILPNPAATASNSFPATVLVYPILSVGGVWTANWLMQLSVLRNMIQLLPYEGRFNIPFPSILELREQIRSVTDLVCSTIPFLLGHVDEAGQPKTSNETPAVGAFFALRALSVVAQLPGLPDVQMKWVSDRLQEIGREKGIHRAILLKESLTEQPVPK